MALREQEAADPRIVGQGRRVDSLDCDCALHIPEPAYIVLVGSHGRPPEQRIAHRLKSLLVLNHPLTLVDVPRRLAVNKARDHRPAGLLELKENDVVRAAALAQRDEGTQSNGADADDLVGDVDQGVAAKTRAQCGGVVCR